MHWHVSWHMYTCCHVGSGDVSVDVDRLSHYCMVTDRGWPYPRSHLRLLDEAAAGHKAWPAIARPLTASQTRYHSSHCTLYHYHLVTRRIFRHASKILSQCRNNLLRRYFVFRIDLLQHREKVHWMMMTPAGCNRTLAMCSKVLPTILTKIALIFLPCRRRLAIPGNRQQLAVSGASQCQSGPAILPDCLDPRHRRHSFLKRDRA